MPVPASCANPTATIIGTDSTSQTILRGFLIQLGICHVQTLDSWNPLHEEIPAQNDTLFFVGWEQWGPEMIQWTTGLKKSGKEAGTAKVFLIIPNDYSLNRVAAIRGGVDGFISFPYSLSNLRQKIQTILPTLIIPSSDSIAHKKAPSQGSLTGGRINL
ncbi:MAG: hypothetical protein AB7T38_00750 [Nitrospirales bacterium]